MDQNRMFLVFCSENYSAFVANNPEKSTEELAKVMSLAWSNLDPGTKAKYKAKAMRKKHQQTFQYGYNVFYSEKYAEIKARYPEASYYDMFKEAASAWKNLDAETKAKYNERAAGSSAWHKLHATTKAKFKELKPIRKKNGYNIFMSENCAEIKARNPEASYPDILREVASAWKNLDPVTRAKYNERTLHIKPQGVEKSRKKHGYNIFVSENYAEIKARNPEASHPDILRELGSAWKNLDQETKAKYNKQVLNTKPQGVQKSRKKYGYNIFFSERYAEIKARNPEASPQVMLQKLGSAWKNLDPETKAKYNERGAATYQDSADSPATKGQ